MNHLNFTKLDVIQDTRDLETIDVSKEPDFYFAKQAWEYEGSAIRDNSLAHWIEIGMAIERGDEYYE
jgi:hypothetical protein